MDNNRHHIDDLFKQSFEQASFKEEDQHWEETYDFLQGKKKRRNRIIGFKWPFLLLLLLGFTFSGLYLGFSNMHEGLPIDSDANAENFRDETPENPIPEPHASIQQSSTVDLPSDPLDYSQNTVVKREISNRNNLTSGHFIKTQSKNSNTLNNFISSNNAPIQKSNISSEKSMSKSYIAFSEIPAVVINKVESEAIQNVQLTISHATSVTKRISIRSYKKWEEFQLMSIVASSKGQGATAFSGLRYGLGVERYFHPNIFVSAMVSIVFQLNNKGFSTVINQASYGLQKTETYYGIQTRHLQYVHAPLLLGYKVGKHKIKAGGALNIYMSAFGTINEINPDLGNEIDEIARGWISAKYAKKYIPEWSFYYSYEFKRMTMGISMHYYTDSFYPTSSIISTNAQQPWAMGINVIYPVSKLF